MDAANDAEIARILAEEQGYIGGDFYGPGESDDNSDYRPGSKSKKKKQQKGATKTKAHDKSDGEEATTKEKGSPKQTRRWTEEEQELFLQGISQYGRNWKQVADHIGSRDYRAVMSHCQKYLIKMFLQGNQLPPKMCESGKGFTLSGKPLDPNSATAKAYGINAERFKKALETGNFEVGTHLTTFEYTEEATKPDKPRKPYQRKKRKADDDTDGITINDCCAQHQEHTTLAAAHDAEIAADADPITGNGGTSTGRPISAPNADASAAPANPPASSNAPLPPATGMANPSPSTFQPFLSNTAYDALPAVEPTEYAKNRPRRRLPSAKAQMGDTTESLDLTHPLSFMGPIASGSPLSQPFKVTLSPHAMLVMDFHAHLSTCEIIGLLGGTFDPVSKAMVVSAAFPCRRTVGSDSGTSVELDAESQVEVTLEMSRRGLTPVGWYHSHPIFAPRPSAKDNENQRNYQALCRDSTTGFEPWIGAIVGPYDRANPSAVSVVQLWVVRQSGKALEPYNVLATLEETDVMPSKDVDEQLVMALEHLKDDVGKINVQTMWRSFSTIHIDSVQGPPLSNAEKIKHALRVHLPKNGKDAEVSAFFSRLHGYFKKVWGVDVPVMLQSMVEVVKEEKKGESIQDEEAVSIVKNEDQQKEEENISIVKNEEEHTAEVAVDINSYATDTTASGDDTARMEQLNPNNNSGIALDAADASMQKKKGGASSIHGGDITIE